MCLSAGPADPMRSRGRALEHESVTQASLEPGNPQSHSCPPEGPGFHKSRAAPGSCPRIPNLPAGSPCETESKARFFGLSRSRQSTGTLSRQREWETVMALSKPEADFAD